MGDIGICQRNGSLGVWHRDHDLSGTHWELLIRLDLATAAYLHDYGYIVDHEHPAAAAAFPGIMLFRDHIEVRRSLRDQDALIMRADVRTDPPAHGITRIADTNASSPPLA